LFFFGTIILREIPTDIQAYPLLIQKVKGGDIYPPANFIYYLVVYTIALFKADTQSLYIASIITLSLAVAAKFAITRVFFVEQYYNTNGFERKSDFTVNQIVTLFSLLMLLIFNLPTSKHWYLGQIPPNVWHNATVIFLMPFALLLFIVSYKQLLIPVKANIIIITLLCILNLLVKPSFFFSFSLAYPLMLLLRFGVTKNLQRNLIPVLIGFILLAVMYYWIYIMNFGSFSIEKSGTAIRPFYVWAHYSSNIFASLGLSLVFPITYFGLYWKDLFKELMVQYSVALYLNGILIFSLFSETGPREFDGNFFWQTVVCSYILFLVLSTLLIKKVSAEGINNWKNTVILIAFLTQVVSGILYIGKILITKAYF
jgi:hypothetical protein